MTDLASAGKLPKMVGSDNELDQVITVLCRRTKADPVLVGPAGVGKTAIAVGLAQRIAEGGNLPRELEGKRQVEIKITRFRHGDGRRT